MRSYFAKQGNKVHSGGWNDVITWSKKQFESETASIDIFTSRGGESNAKIVAEITQEGMRIIPNGRIVTLKALLNGRK